MSHPLNTKVDAEIPGGAESQLLQAGGTLNFRGITAKIDTIGVPCGEERVVNLCAELFRPEDTTNRYKLSGYNASLQEEDDSYLVACMKVGCQGKWA